MTQSATAHRILDIAQRLVQLRGFNAFSFTDVAQELGLKDASIHYHFTNKATLGRAVVKRYREHFAAHLAAISHTKLGPAQQLERYVQLYRDVVGQDGRICLCGVLASELLTLPGEVQAEVRAFFYENEAWLAQILQAGREAGELHFDAPADVEAQAFLASLEGAMLLARSHGDATRFEPLALRLLAALRQRA